MPFWDSPEKKRQNAEAAGQHVHTYATQEDGKDGPETAIEMLGGHEVQYQRERTKYKSVCTAPGCGHVSTRWNGEWTRVGS